MSRAVWMSLVLAGCAVQPDDETTTDDAIASANAWYHLDAAHGLGAATLSVTNNYSVRCPNGHSAKTCDVTSLVVPASCGFECTDGLLGLQGESLVRGSFQGHAFVIADGLDTWERGLGTYSVYAITGAPSCAHDPCPTGLVAQKLNTKAAPTAIASVDFSHANDTNFVLDPTRGDAAAATTGLIVSGHIVSHQFRVDRTWRLETGAAACDPQATARAHTFLGGATEVTQLRTVTEAERHVDPNGGDVAWLVRTAETPTTVTFTSGLNDLWDEVFDVAKSDCTVTTTGEH